MERAIALKKLGKLLGKKLGYRIDNKAPTQMDRDAAKSALPTAIAERDKLKEKRDARYKEILAADIEYQNLHAAHKAAYEYVSKLSGIRHHHKIVVGTYEGFFFNFKASGDSWEEIISKLIQEKQAA